MHFRPPASAIHFEFQQMGHALVTAGQDMTILLMGVVSRICGRGDVFAMGAAARVVPLPFPCRSRSRRLGGGGSCDSSE